MRRAFTLIELIIAMSIFSMLMAAALECFGSAQRYVNQESTQNDLLLEGRRVMAEMITDLSNSAWYLPLDENGDGVVRPTDVHDLECLKDGTLDRGLRYYPYIEMQSPSGQGAAFPRFARAASAVPDATAYPPTLPPVHRLPSQEIIYLKVSTAAAAATPAQLTTQRVNFNNAITPITTFTAARDGVSASGVMTAITGSGAAAMVSDIPLAWESNLVAPDGNNANTLREYSYVVRPNARTGKGQLERWYRNGAAGVGTGNSDNPTDARLDHVLCSDVDRVVFDTSRTTSGLNVNQIRVALYLSRELEKQPGLYQTIKVEATMALRSTVDPEYSLNLGSWLGTGGTFTVH